VKTGSLRILFLFLLAALPAGTAVFAQTVLVHRASVQNEPDENSKLYSQSAEAGIMDVLFDKGCIAFSEMSELDEPGIIRLAVRTGSDYILNWSLSGSLLRGSLTAASGDAPQTISAEVDRSDLKGEYKTPADLYAALGSALCTSLVGDRW